MSHDVAISNGLIPEPKKIRPRPKRPFHFASKSMRRGVQMVLARNARGKRLAAIRESQLQAIAIANVRREARRMRRAVELSQAA